MTGSMTWVILNIHTDAYRPASPGFPPDHEIDHVHSPLPEEILDDAEIESVVRVTCNPPLSKRVPHKKSNKSSQFTLKQVRAITEWVGKRLFPEV